MSGSPLRIGVAGLGRAFTLMLPTFVLDPRVRLVAACDPVDAARRRFEQDFDAPTYDSVEALCADASVQIVYLATPHQWHCEHVRIAAVAGKHILVEKPMAISLAECTKMIGAAHAAGVWLVVGHSHSFDLPIRRTRELVASGAYGPVRMINALNYTDFMYRARRPEELVAALGGGAVLNQGAHQVDVVRSIATSPVETVRAFAGTWDPQRPVEGAYQALLGFADGSSACLVYSGYGHFDSDVWMGDIGETGMPKKPGEYGAARQRLVMLGSGNDIEANAKAGRNYGGKNWQPASPENPVAYQHFGMVVVSCDRADLRPTASGVAIDGDVAQSFVGLPQPLIPRKEVIDELHAAVVDGIAPLHEGMSARATVEICEAILRSARLGRELRLRHQTIIGQRSKTIGEC